MGSYIIRRLALGILTLLFVSVLSFVIIQLPPGDFVTTYIQSLESSHLHMSLERAAALRAHFGLNQSVFVQYFLWMGHLLRGDLGMSLDLNRPVLDVIKESLPLTVVVSIVSLIVAELIALPIGIYSAVRQYSILDNIFTFIAFVGLGVPDFLIALVILYVGFLVFHTNIGGLFSIAYVHAGWSWGKFFDLLKHLPIPIFILGVLGVGSDIRIMRANLLDELRKPYVVTARAKGLSERRLLVKYPVRAALNPFVSDIGFLLPQIVSGTVIVSFVLGLPTLGPVFLHALLVEDMFLAGDIVLLLAALTIIGTLISDLLLAWVDPRIRYG
jgi:peptide/nickel transport system permease protein